MLINQEKFRIFGYKVPLYFFFAVSGALCDIVQAFIDYGIYSVYPFEWEKTTMCWTVSYTASVIVRHFSHRLLVFGEYEGSYCSSLCRTYLTYASSIVMSMVTNHFIVSFLEFNHINAWIITMLWTGVYNYFMLRASWKKSAPITESKPIIDSDVKPISSKLSV
jgi:hypothetical protein